MPIALSAEQQAALNEVQPITEPSEFEAVHQAAKAEMNRIVTEVMEPNQGIDDTLLGAEDVYVHVYLHQVRLVDVGYGAERKALFRDAIRLAKTATAWFSESKRSGAYRARTVEQVLAASRPWRARLKSYGEQAFAFEPTIAEQFADVNSTGTLEEEKTDLLLLTNLVQQHADKLQAVGMKPEFVAKGRTLLEEANGHGILGILGIRSQDEAIVLRNRIFTYLTLLAKHARAAGINAFFEEPAIRDKFEAASFRNALRRVSPRRRAAPDGGGEAKADGQKTEAAKPQEAKPEAAKPEGAKPEGAKGEEAKPQEAKPQEPKPEAGAAPK